MKREKSCGAVLVRRAVSGWETLLIRHANGGHWAFPKGHVEPGETEAQTALREIREETAIADSLWPGFRTVISYSPREGVVKEVVYFLAMPQGGGFARQREEVLDMRWVPAEEAAPLITHANNRAVWLQALRYLREQA